MKWPDAPVSDTLLSEEDKITERPEIPLSDKMTEKPKMSFDLSEEDQMIARDSYGCFLQNSKSKVHIPGLWFLCQPALTLQENDTWANVQDVFMR